MSTRGWVIVAAAIAVAAVVGVGVVVHLTTPGRDDGPVPAASSPATTIDQAAAAFLDRYVDPDGRVVRHDQGGDTVSEGQAYALLVAVAVGDRERFATVWQWTRDHLMRPDGLLSWRWQAGSIADPESAADADLDAARALVLAGTAFGDPALSQAGSALGTAVLDHETVQVATGRILAAGSWVTTEPYGYNPSYASPAATAVLARATPDGRWAELDRGSRSVTAAALDQAALPPDWAQVQPDGSIEARSGPDGRSADGVRYSYDATRLPLRFAESCQRDDAALAARLVTGLDRSPGAFAALDLGGQPLTQDESVVAAAGRAAAYAAAGDPARARFELDRMAQLDQRAPSYYGAAWNALGRIMITSSVLDGCPPLA